MDPFVFIILVFFSLVLSTYSQNPTVYSTLGKIIGNTSNVRLEEGLIDRNVHEYLGIPFAIPPVGNLRFRKSELMTTLPSPFRAQRHGAICPQLVWTTEYMGVPQSEDCLFINVYVPERDDTYPADGYAVMVWIHGGGFIAKASNFFNGSTLAAVGNIIVVTFNYRLDALGFLSTNDDKEPGNFGLWDQHLALQWVHDYIGDFGGDNKRVTIAGLSAGAMSVMQQAFSPKINRGLFQRIIAQSGTMSNPTLVLDRDGWKDTITIAGSLGCKTDLAEEVMDCLREKTVDEILTALQNLYISFGPLVDGDLIEINPLHIANISDRQRLEEVEFFRSFDMLSGFSAFEGAFMLLFAIDPEQLENIQPTREEMKTQYLPVFMRFLFDMDFAEGILKLVEAQYTNWTNPDHYNSIRLQITKFAGDIAFGVPAVEMSRLHKSSASGKNFMYHFAPKTSIGEISTPSWVPGATHANDLPFVLGDFGKIGVGEENAWEKELAMRMMKYWTNFVKTGDPNSDKSVSPKWPEYNIETGDYLVLDKSMSEASAKQHFYAEEANFWLDVFPDLVDAIQDTGGCGNGTLTSAAPNFRVYSSLSVTAMMLVAFFSVF